MHVSKSHPEKKVYVPTMDPPPGFKVIFDKPKSKSKSRLTTEFSLKLDFPTIHPQPPGKVSKKQVTIIYS